MTFHPYNTFTKSEILFGKDNIMGLLLPGSMKTYWLKGREARTPIKRSIVPPVAEPDINDVPERRSYAMRKSSDDRRSMYSPITFQDVARRSIANSPIKSYSNSRGKDLVYLTQIFVISLRFSVFNRKLTSSFNVDRREQVTVINSLTILTLKKS